MTRIKAIVSVLLTGVLVASCGLRDDAPTTKGAVATCMKAEGFDVDTAPKSEEFAAALAVCTGDAPTVVRKPRPSFAVGKEWTEIQPGGDCGCADGTAFVYWVRQGDPRKVLLYLNAGGACFSSQTCDPVSGAYSQQVAPPRTAGLFNFAHPRNPFADYTVINVPYCSGDLFLGNATKAYRADLTIDHRGYPNAMAAVDHLAKTYAKASSVTVAGSSAGAVATPLYATLVARKLPHARVTAIADGSGAYPGQASLTEELTTAWHTDDAIKALTGGSTDWSIPGLFTLAAREDPDITFARHDYAYDSRQTAWLAAAKFPIGDLLAQIDANERQIESGGGARLLSFTAAGKQHVALTDSPFFTEVVGGQRLTSWIAQLISGRPVADVHCTSCQ